MTVYERLHLPPNSYQPYPRKMSNKRILHKWKYATTHQEKGKGMVSPSVANTATKPVSDHALLSVL